MPAWAACLLTAEHDAAHAKTSISMKPSTHHATTLTMSSPMTMVREASMVVETSVFLKSQDTSGRSLIARIPLDLPLAASLNASFTCTGQQRESAQRKRGYGRCQISRREQSWTQLAF